MHVYKSLVNTLAE